MNYQNAYDRLIDRARNRVLEGYKERHHVLPRSLGGTDESSNLVDLTAPEHYVAHQLLVKIFPGNAKMIFAAHAMLMQGQGTRRDLGLPRNKEFGWLRELNAKAIAERRKGVKHSPETLKKMSDKRQLRVITDETRQKTSKSMEGRKPAPQTVEANRERMTGSVGLRNGMTNSSETRAKQSEAARSRADKEENDCKMRAGRARMTPEQRTAQAKLAWKTRRANGTDKFSDEQRAKMSASQQNRTESPEAATARALKAHETRRANGTDTYSAEQRQRMSEAHKGKKQSPETVAKRIATRERNKALKAAA